MRRPEAKAHPDMDEDKFINSAEGETPELQPWKKNLSKRYEKESGKIINIRLSEHYAECLAYLAEKNDRSQHKQLVNIVCKAIDDAIKNESN